MCTASNYYQLPTSAGHPHLYPPDTTSPLAYRPLGLASRHSSHPGPAYQLPISTAGSSVSSSLSQLSHQYAQSSPFPFVASTSPQHIYHPGQPFQPRQSLPYTPVLQPVPPYLPPRGLPVSYVSPVSSSLAGHQAIASYTPPGSTERLPSAQASFSGDDSFPAVSQGVPPAPNDRQQQQQQQQQQQNTTTPPQGWNPNPPNYP